MASSEKNLSEYQPGQLPDGSEFKIGICVSRWNEDITNALLEGCIECLKENKVKLENIYIQKVPGSFELPYGAHLLDQKYKPDALICLGCVIKGETSHNEYINQSVASALMQLSLMRNKPYVFGVLTPNNKDQALERAGGKHGNKGVEAAITALEMTGMSITMKKPDKSIGFK
jgi:6,7-dimethyl-8-ribityllumazine synthase